MTTVLRRGGDWTALIEAAQYAAGDDETWARGVADAASGLFLTSGRPGLRVLEHSPTCDSARYLTVAMTDTFGHDEGDGGLDALGVADFRTLYYPPGCVTTFRERERSFSGDAAGVAETMRASIGVSDAVGLFAYPEPGLVVFLAAMHDREVSLSRHDRRLLARIGLHLETSYRLRRRPEAIKAVLDLDGRVLERTDDAPSPDVLTAYAAGMNRARSEREGEEALAIWPALVAGRFSLVERRDGAKRRYLLVENAASSQPLPRPLARGGGGRLPGGAGPYVEDHRLRPRSRTIHRLGPPHARGRQDRRVLPHGSRPHRRHAHTRSARSLRRHRAHRCRARRPPPPPARALQRTDRGDPLPLGTHHRQPGRVPLAKDQQRFPASAPRHAPARSPRRRTERA